LLSLLKIKSMLPTEFHRLIYPPAGRAVFHSASQPKNVATNGDSLYLPARRKSGWLSCEFGPASVALTADVVPGLIVGRSQQDEFIGCAVSSVVEHYLDTVAI